MIARLVSLLLTVVLAVAVLLHVEAADEYTDEGLTRVTDDLGMLWDFDRGVGGSIEDGTRDLFDGGLRSYIEENADLQQMTAYHQYRNRQPAAARVRRHSGTGEWVVDVPSSSLEVQRRILPDRAGFVRYMEVVTNPNKQAVPVQVHIFSDTGTSVQSVMDDQGRSVTQGPVAEDVRGYVLTQSQRNDLLFYLGENTDQTQVFTQYQGDNHMLSYAFTVEAGATVAITYTVGQRSAGSGIDEAFLAHASERDFYDDLSRALRRALLNGPSFGIGLGAVYTLDALNITGHAQQAVFGQGEHTRLLGIVDWRSARVRTPFGEHAFAVDELAGMTGSAHDPRRQVVFLRDGQILSGDLVIEDFVFKHDSGFTMVDQAHMIDRLLAPRVNPDNYVIDGWGIALIDGNRLRLRPPRSEQRIQLRSPWGDVHLPLSAIQSLKRPSDDELLAWHLQSAEGQIMRVYPLQTTIRVDSELFGPLDIPLASVLEFLAPQLPTADDGDEQQTVPTPQAGKAVVTMVDGARLVGGLSLTDVQLLDRERNPIRVPMKQVTRIESRAGRTTVILDDGSQIAGWWDRAHLPIISRDREMTIPINAISVIELQAPALSPAERALILDLVRSLASADWVEREEATRALRDKGASAHALLERQLAQSEDPEVQHRITLILEGE